MDALLDAPDAATGLVHLGGGRWYDPALGRPLQPSPTGGPPTLPQALNRYAATPVGQPGVYEAAANDSFNWTPHAVGFAKNTAVELAREVAPPATRRIATGYSYRAMARIWIDFGESAAYVFPPYAEEIVHAYRGVKGATRGTIWATVEGANLRQSADHLVESLRQTFPDATISYRGLNAGSMTSFGIYGEVADPTSSQILGPAINLTYVGFGLDVAIGAAFQLGQDYGNPYLSGGQVAGRAIVAGAGGAFTSAGLVGLLCVTGAPACVVVAGVGGGVIWSQGLQPVFFQALGLAPSDRDLQLLYQP